MHHALQIEEILCNIFHHYPTVLDRYYRHKPDSTLVALARTCRTFKEPALNALWMDLNTLTPLVRCLPEASCQVPSSSWYSFNRLLTQTERDLLRGYARRIRCIRNFEKRLDEKAFKMLSNSPTTEPLFPNLRHLHCRYDETTMPLLNLPLPSLVYLDVSFQNAKMFQASLNSFAKFSPNIRDLYFALEDESGTIEPGFTCHWKNLSSVATHCQNGLDMNDLIHLSHMPALITLEFTLGATLPDPDSSLSFSNLHHLKLISESLISISRLISHSCLPAITKFYALVHDHPSRSAFASFLSGLLTSKADHSIRELSLVQTHPQLDRIRSEATLLGFELLQLGMAFSQLHHLDLSTECNVCLADNDLLTLASAWPQLDVLRINSGWGWNSQYGITPGGLVRLWQTCPSLSLIELRLDTRGYAQSPPSEAPENLRVALTLPPRVTVSVLDAAIEAESVPAVATFFCGIAACCESEFWLHFWDSEIMERFPNAEEYKGRWDEVRARAYGPRIYQVDSDEYEWLE